MLTYYSLFQRLHGHFIAQHFCVLDWSIQAIYCTTDAPLTDLEELNFEH